MDKLQELYNRQVELTNGMLAIQSKADEEKRDLTEDEATEIEARLSEIESVVADIERRKQIEAAAGKMAEPRGRKTDPDPANQPRRSTVEPSAKREPGKCGWNHFGEFAAAVRKAGRDGLDPRLVANAMTTYGAEGTNADGGYAVPPDFRSEILKKVQSEESLLSRTDQLTSSTNSITIPTDETTGWQGSGGVLAAWENEGSQFSQTKPSVGQVIVRLNKLGALIPVTEELLEDAPALGTYLGRKVPEKFTYKINDAILNGDGSGKPLGVLHEASPAVVPTITAGAEVGQAADTVVFKNIVNMWSRLAAQCRPNAVWLINQDVEPQLMQMSFPGTGTAVPAYLPPGGLSASPYGLLLGRPVLPIEACATVGDRGDIVLADLSQYMSIMRIGGGIRQDVSMHLYFDYDAVAFRFVMRVGGKPWWAGPITPQNGSNTRSCFVALADRTGSGA